MNLAPPDDETSECKEKRVCVKTMSNRNVHCADGHACKDRFISLTKLLARRTWKGPKQSSPTVVNGGLSGTKRSPGKSAIFCSQNGTSRFR